MWIAGGIGHTVSVWVSCVRAEFEAQPILEGLVVGLMYDEAHNMLHCQLDFQGMHEHHDVGMVFAPRFAASMDIP